jgi:hypothetical protein
MQERKKRNVSVRVRETFEFDAFGIDQSLDQGGLPGGHEKRRVDIAGDQLVNCRSRLKPG